MHAMRPSYAYIVSKLYQKKAHIYDKGIDLLFMICYTDPRNGVAVWCGSGFNPLFLLILLLDDIVLRDETRRGMQMAKKSSPWKDYSAIERAVWPLAEQAATACAAEVIDVEFVHEAGSAFLRVFLDREESPVDHVLCEAVSDRLGALLDEADLIAESYYLEISSPGIERPLRREKDFERFCGRDIVVKLYAPYEGAKEYQGRLLGLQEGCIMLQTESAVVSLPLEQVSKAHLLADFS